MGIGEFRSDGGLTIIQGLHANKVDHYRFLNKMPVVEVGLDQLVWLDGRPMDQVLKTGMYTRTLEHEISRNTDTENIITDGGWFRAELMQSKSCQRRLNSNCANPE